MIFDIFSSNLYIRIWKNRINVRDVENNIQVEESSAESFTGKRILVGDFTVADQLLRKLIQKINKNKFIVLNQNIVIHPLEMIEGGISQTEARILRELAAVQNARKIILNIGHELSDFEVMNMIKSYNKLLKDGTPQSGAP